MLFALHADLNRSVQPGPGCGMLAKGSKSGKGGFGATRAPGQRDRTPGYARIWEIGHHCHRIAMNGP
jgi:hypothetical protein